MRKKLHAISFKGMPSAALHCIILSITWVNSKTMRAFESLYLRRKRVLASLITLFMLIAQTPRISFAVECVGAHTYVNGICTAEGCGAYEPAVPSDNGTPSDTTDDYYVISNAGQLFWFSLQVNSGNVGINGKLTESIDLNPGFTFDANGTYSGGDSVRSWIPIGNETSAYSGTFDGNGKTVSGLYFNDDTKNTVGLFGNMRESGTVKGVGVINSYMHAGIYVGGVCGENNGTIERCYNTGAVNGHQHVGGVCGYNNGMIERCYNTGAVSGDTTCVGGVCGSSWGFLSYSYNIGTIIGGDYYVGGVCGSSWGFLSYSYNIGTITGGNNYVGGVCGFISNTPVRCFYLSGCATDGNNTEQYGIGNETLGEATDDDSLHTSGHPFYDFMYDDVTNALNDNGFPYAWYQGDEYPLLVMYPKATLINGVYEISNAEQLLWFSFHVSIGSTYLNGKLTTDIDLNPGYYFNTDGTCSGGNSVRSWIPIGNATSAYSGTFDGNGKTVSGLYYFNDLNNYVGLFGYIGLGGVVKNVAVTNSYMYGYNYVGGIGGHNAGMIVNCYSTGTINGHQHVGGVCGSNDGLVKNCYNTGTIKGSNYVGGVCGNSAATTENCYYLIHCATDSTSTPQNGIGNETTATSTADSNGITAVKSFDDFADGSVTYALNGNRSEGTAENPLVWYQNIDNGEPYDDIPKFTGGIVYFQSSPSKYSNSQYAVYSVTITWGTMSFTYVDEHKGTWNSSTLSYENLTPAAWTCDTNANKIAVTSSSSVDVAVSFNFTAIEGATVDANFTDGTNPVVMPLSLAVGTETPQTVVVYLTPSGKPDETADNTVIGTVTIAILPTTLTPESNYVPEADPVTQQ